eukprot:118500-Lingulodinium_polyedra.AAC.1
MQCIETGRVPTRRYLHPVRRVSVAWLRGRFIDTLARFQLLYEVTIHVCVDLYTKMFIVASTWTHECRLITLLQPCELYDVYCAGG